MQIIFLGSVFPQSLLKMIERNSKGNIQYASDALQWHFLNGFVENNCVELNIVNAPMLGSFPFFYKKLFIPATKFSVKENEIGNSIKYFNLAILKNKFIEYKLTNELKILLNQMKKGQTTIIVYGMHFAYMKAVMNIKRSDLHVNTCLIVPDLPEYMGNSKGIIWKIRSLIQPNLYKLLPAFNSFVLLTDAMAEPLKLKNKPWVRIEGMVNPDEHKSARININSKKRIILYSGTLASRYGILDLLSAFEMIDNPNYELWICGAGNTESVIKEKARKNSRIKYYGIIARKDVLILQQNATVLVNPRTSNGEYTKYSFPSKTMEYLLSGIPTIMYHLPGIPNEYNEYLHFVPECNTTALRNKIFEVCELDSESRFIFGQKARNFVLENKDYLSQTKKVLDMLIKI